MQIDEVTRPGWEAAANFFRERDRKYNYGLYGSKSATKSRSMSSSHSDRGWSELTVLPTQQKRVSSVMTDNQLEERQRKRSKSASGLMVGGFHSIIIWFGILIRC